MSLFPQISVVFTLQRDFLQQIKIIVLPQQKKKKQNFGAQPNGYIYKTPTSKAQESLWKHKLNKDKSKSSTLNKDLQATKEFHESLFQRRSHQLVIQYKVVSPDNIHNNTKQTNRLFMCFGIYMYIHVR